MVTLWIILMILWYFIWYHWSQVLLSLSAAQILCTMLAQYKLKNTSIEYRHCILNSNNLKFARMLSNYYYPGPHLEGSCNKLLGFPLESEIFFSNEFLKWFTFSLRIENLGEARCINNFWSVLSMGFSHLTVRVSIQTVSLSMVKSQWWWSMCFFWQHF